jgi:hypothetical protein
LAAVDRHGLPATKEGSQPPHEAEGGGGGRWDAAVGEGEREELDAAGGTVHRLVGEVQLRRLLLGKQGDEDIDAGGLYDDLGMEVGCYGNKVIQTPNIDALAKNGSRFTHSFATVSSCSPSRACLYSGLYTHTSGQYGLAHATHHFRSQENIKSLPRVLKDAGYHCAILVSRRGFANSFRRLRAVLLNRTALSRQQSARQ